MDGSNTESSDTFLAAIASVLQQYPPDIVQHVCDPRTGLPRTAKWMPSVAEVVEACDERSAEKAKIRRYENWGNADDEAEERERLKDQGRLPPPKEARPTLEQLKAKYPPNWGLGGVLPANEMAPQKQAKPAWMTPEWEASMAAYKTPMLPPADKSYLTGRASFEPDPSIAAGRDAAQPVQPIVDADGNELDQGADF